MMPGIVDVIADLARAPQADLDLDMRETSAAVMRDDDGDLVLVLKDELSTVSIEPGLAGKAACIERAEEIAAAALSYAELMRATLGVDPSRPTPAGTDQEGRQ